MKCRVVKFPQCGQEPADQSAAAGQHIGCGSPEPFVIQGPANEVGVSAESLCRNRCGHHVPHTVGAGLRRRAIVIRPGQHAEFKVVVSLEIVDQRGAPAYIGVLEFARGAIADNSVKVGQGCLDRVVAAGTAQHSVAGEPHSATAGVGSRSAELVSGLQQCDRQPFASRRVRAGDSTAGPGDDDVNGFVVASHQIVSASRMCELITP